MSQSLTIQLPDDLQQTLLNRAAQTQLTLEQIILTTLNQQFLQPTTPDLTDDPLFQLAGCITSNIPGLAENHGYYLGQALYQEMNRDAE